MCDRNSNVYVSCRCWYSLFNLNVQIDFFYLSTLRVFSIQPFYGSTKNLMIEERFCHFKSFTRWLLGSSRHKHLWQQEALDTPRWHSVFITTKIDEEHVSWKVTMPQHVGNVLTSDKGYIPCPNINLGLNIPEYIYPNRCKFVLTS